MNPRELRIIFCKVPGIVLDEALVVGDVPERALIERDDST
jgi:hypothetical protein